MYSFSGLMKNEYLKIIKKTSGKVMLVIVLLMMIGYPVILKIANVKMTEMINEPVINDSTDYFKDRAAQLSPETPYYDLKIDLLDYMSAREQNKTENEEDNTSYSNFYYVDTDWRRMAAFKAAASNDKQEIQKLAIFCKTNDWRGYASYQLSQPDISEEQKWVLNYRLEHDIPIGSKSEESILVNKIAVKTEAVNYADDGAQKKLLQEDLKKLKYQLENKEYYDTSKSGGIEALANPDAGFWDIYMMTPMLLPYFGYIMIVIAGGIVASEFSQGTIKFLLINPVKRWKILVAKYLTVLSLGGLMLLALALITVPVIGLLFGFNHIDAPYLYISGDEVHQMNSFFAVVRSYLLSSVELVVIITLAFALSSVARNSAMAVGFGIALMSIGKAICIGLSDMGLDWARYIIFANTDLEIIASGNSPYPDHTLPFAVAVIAVYMFVFLLTAWDGFTKKSV